ncbi:MAG: hypothetical protein A3F74_09700 [Betaproteobacteria bacterium RIFCSPLOWO2_12_FULL_62_58]|nr:MAG: hypothetical protein A3F74_09700 [Betaproteobacteria bacterium RIFCSPLOWO2_12_FULL_62_58]
MQIAPQPANAALSLEYPLPDLPAPGTAKQVRTGVFWLRMPLPFALKHINLWLLEDGTGWTIVDCGLGTDTTRTLWEQIFAGGLDGRPARRLIVTHCHPDHIGLAAWLCEKFGLKPCMTSSEYVHAHAVYHRVGGTDHAALRTLHERHGLDGARLDALRSRADHYRRGVPSLPNAFERIKHEEQIVIGENAWRVIVGHGHSPEHAALYCESLGVLIAGDMLLPRISTNVSVWPMEPEGDPLGEFLTSLERFGELPADTLVLPSHGLPFRGMHHRIAELNRHHQTRLDRLIAVCERPSTAAELLPQLFERNFDDYHLVFAMGETIAHLNHLMHRGVLKRGENPDGIHRFVRRPLMAKA